MLENPKVQPLEETFGFGHGDHPTYPFAEWDDDEGHRAVQGETFDSSPETFVRHARRWAHARAKGVLVRYERGREPVSVAFQFVPADHPLLTKPERDALRPAEAGADAGQVADADVVADGDATNGELADAAGTGETDDANGAGSVTALTPGHPGAALNTDQDDAADPVDDFQGARDGERADSTPDGAELADTEPEAEGDDATSRDAGRRRTGWRGGGR